LDPDSTSCSADESETAALYQEGRPSGILVAGTADPSTPDLDQSPHHIFEGTLLHVSPNLSNENDECPEHGVGI
jgi:hypothetical protein